MLASEAEAETLALWLEINGESNGAYTYDMYFQALADAGAGDVVGEDDGLPWSCPSRASTRCRGPRSTRDRRAVRAGWSS